MHNRTESARIIVSCILIAIVVVTVSAAAKFAFKSSKAPDSHQTKVAGVSTSPAVMFSDAAPNGKSAPVHIARELVTIHPFGFEPAELTSPSSRFLLDVQNRSGLREVVLRLDRETGARLRQERVPRAKLDWRTVIDLPPGSYLLTEEKHPAWVCRITITAR
ncbi:MAG: hypothetical protein ACKVZH_29460 [Blastocatellia bacterium]